eukprot:3051966-Amphidinium_carterae.2
MSLRVDVVDGMGRVVVACRNFDIHDIVLEEEPLLVWTRDDWASFAQGFLHLDKKKQDTVMDLYHPDLDAPSEFLTRAMAGVGCMAKYLEERTALKLGAIELTNAYQFMGGDLKDQIALFDLASKVLGVSPTFPAI